MRIERTKLRTQVAAGCAAGAASGLAMYLAFPPADLAFLGFIALAPLYAVFRKRRFGGAAAAFAAFGLVFFGLLISWIKLFGLPAYTALLLLQTLWVFAVLSAGHVLVKKGSAPWLVFPLAFVAGEYLRSRFPFGGFGWGGLGYAAHDMPAVLKLASYTGVWGISALMTATAVLVTEAAYAFRGGRVRPYLLAGAAAAAVFAPGFLPAGAPQGAEMPVTMIQADVPEDTFDPHADDVSVVESHAELTRRAAKSRPSLVIWAESSVDRDPFKHPELGAVVRRSVREASTWFLIGGILDSPNPLEGELQNVSMLFRPDAALAGIYVKQRPVPFGERVYFRRLLEPLIEELQRVPRDMAAGNHATVFRIPDGKVASVICYESTYPDLVREMVNNGAGLLVVSTNNSSYARTAASSQHVAFSQLRAAEHRMWVAHAALSGISAVVAPDGRVVERTEIFRPAITSRVVRFAGHRTPYALAGDWLPVGAIAGLGWLGALHAAASLGRRRSLQDEPPAHPPAALVVIPTYNEAEHIEKVVVGLLASCPDASVLIVDDGSPDGTGEIADRLAAGDARVKVMKRASKQGLGSAYIQGFAWGLQRGYARYVEMDADLSHDPSDVPRLLAASGDRRLALGSRYVAGGSVVGWSRGRHLLSRMANLYAKVVLGLPVNDSTSGFRCYPRAALEEIGLGTIESEGYAFQIEMAYRAHRLGYGIVEVPIVFRERASGKSKMSSAIVIEAITSVARWAVRDRKRSLKSRLPELPEDEN